MAMAIPKLRNSTRQAQLAEKRTKQEQEESESQLAVKVEGAKSKRSSGAEENRMQPKVKVACLQNTESPQQVPKRYLKGKYLDVDLLHVASI